MSVTYTYRYRKDGVEHTEQHTFENNPTLAEINAQMDSYEPDEKLDYIRND